MNLPGLQEIRLALFLEYMALPAESRKRDNSVNFGSDKLGVGGVSGCCACNLLLKKGNERYGIQEHMPNNLDVIVECAKEEYEKHPEAHNYDSAQVVMLYPEGMLHLLASTFSNPIGANEHPDEKLNEIITKRWQKAFPSIEVDLVPYRVRPDIVIFNVQEEKWKAANCSGKFKSR